MHKDEMKLSDKAAFQKIMQFIKDNDSLNVSLYTNIEISTHGMYALNECYHHVNRDDSSCYKSMPSGLIILHLKHADFEDFSVYFWKFRKMVSFSYEYWNPNYHNEKDKHRNFKADFDIELILSEEEYFQQSTVHDLVLTYEENLKLLNFIKDFGLHIEKRKQEKQDGQSTS